MSSGEASSSSLWTDLRRARPSGLGWIGWFAVYGIVHAISDVTGITIVAATGAPRDLAFGVITISVFLGFLAAQAVTLLSQEMLRRQGRSAGSSRDAGR